MFYGTIKTEQKIPEKKSKIIYLNFLKLELLQILVYIHSLPMHRIKTGKERSQLTLMCL